MEKTKEYRTTYNSEIEELSITIIEKIEIDGEVFTKPSKFCSFRKSYINDDGVKVENENYHAEIDAWTGEKDFIKNKVNS